MFYSSSRKCAVQEQHIAVTVCNTGRLGNNRKKFFAVRVNSRRGPQRGCGITVCKHFWLKKKKSNMIQLWNLVLLWSDVWMRWPWGPFPIFWDSKTWHEVHLPEIERLVHEALNTFVYPFKWYTPLMHYIHSQKNRYRSLWFPLTNVWILQEEMQCLLLSSGMYMCLGHHLS